MFQSISNLFIKETEGGDLIFTMAGYVGLVILLLLFLAAIAVFSKSNRKMKTKQVVFSAVAIALAVVTSFIKFASLPFGGSITLFSMFFICFIGYLYGLKVGLITGIAYGILQLITSPYIYHPLQILLDYPLAFGCLGLSGIFSNPKFKLGKFKYNLIKGYIVGVLGRYICHVISGYIFFSSYAPEGMNPMIYTLGYNATYIVPEAIATILVLFLLAFSNAIGEVKRMANEA